MSSTLCLQGYRPAPPKPFRNDSSGSDEIIADYLNQRAAIHNTRAAIHNTQAATHTSPAPVAAESPDRGLSDNEWERWLDRQAQMRRLQPGAWISEPRHMCLWHSGSWETLCSLRRWVVPRGAPLFLRSVTAAVHKVTAQKLSPCPLASSQV